MIGPGSDKNRTNWLIKNAALCIDFDVPFRKVQRGPINPIKNVNTFAFSKQPSDPESELA